MNRAKWSNVECFSYCKTILYQQNTKVLREVSGRCVYISTEKNDNLPKHAIVCILNSIDSKIHKEKENKKLKNAPELLLKVYFDSLGLKMITLNRMLRQPSISMKLPKKNSDDARSMIVHTLCPTIRVKIFKYKQTVPSLWWWLPFPTKLEEVMTLVANWMHKATANVHDLSTISGKLFYVAQCCPSTRYFVNGMLEHLAGALAKGSSTYRTNLGRIWPGSEHFYP